MCLSSEDADDVSRAAIFEENLQMSMRDRPDHEVTFVLSEAVNSRLRHFMDATGLNASAVVDLSLEMLFEGQPDTTIIDTIRLLSGLDNEPK